MIDLTRRTQIVMLLQTRNDHLPHPLRRDNTTSGFAHGAENRTRSCPDCLANGKPTPGCETCGGSGRLTPDLVDRVSLADALADDDKTADPYAQNDAKPYGLDSTRHDRGYARDAEISRLGQQTREAFATEADALADANAHPYGWELARGRMLRDFDYVALDIALEVLRDRDEGGYRLLHAVYVYGWTDHSTVVEAAVERALRFIDGRMPDPIRAPGDPAPVVAKESLWRGRTDRHTAAREARTGRVLRAFFEWGWTAAQVAAHESLTERRVRQIVARESKPVVLEDELRVHEGHDGKWDEPIRRTTHPTRRADFGPAAAASGPA